MVVEAVHTNGWKRPGYASTLRRLFEACARLGSIWFQREETVSGGLTGGSDQVAGKKSESERLCGTNRAFNQIRVDATGLGRRMECLSRVVLISEQHLRFIVHEYVEHYHRERNHQGLDNQLLERAPPPADPDTGVHRRERIGGLLNYYHREAA